MINSKNISSIEKLLNKKIRFSKLLSSSFGINCIKIITTDNISFVVKYYEKINKKFNAIDSETKNLLYMNELSLEIFPKIFAYSNNYIIMSYLDNDKNQPAETKFDLLDAITSLHSLNEIKFGFDFDTQIGGLKQKNNKSDNWVNFYREYRLGYIYEIINSSNLMDESINKKIEYLIKNLESFIPKKPIASLLHGDLWEGNILFNNYKFCGFIDPGSFYGHNELEIAYLRWFNPIFIDEDFIEKYSTYIKIEKEYFSYEPIYQLYYSLLNVYLWDKNYIEDVKRLLNKIGI